MGLETDPAKIQGYLKMKRFEEEFVLSEIMRNGSVPVCYLEMVNAESWHNGKLGVEYKGKKVLPFYQFPDNEYNGRAYGAYMAPALYGKEVGHIIDVPKEYFDTYDYVYFYYNSKTKVHGYNLHGKKQSQYSTIGSFDKMRYYTHYRWLRFVDVVRGIFK